jgi:hypothetical protein
MRTTIADPAGLSFRRGWDSNPRTPVKMLLEFQSSAFDRSATSPIKDLRHYPLAIIAMRGPSRGRAMISGGRRRPHRLRRGKARWLIEARIVGLAGRRLGLIERGDLE